MPGSAVKSRLPLRAGIPANEPVLQQRRASANRRLVVMLGLLALAFYAGFIVLMALR